MLVVTYSKEVARTNMEHALLRGTQGRGPARDCRIRTKRKYTLTVSTCVVFIEMLCSED